MTMTLAWLTGLGSRSSLICIKYGSLITNRRETATLRDLGMDWGRIPLNGRDSDIRPLALPGDDTEDTFVFTVPQREVQEQEDDRLSGNLQEAPHRVDIEDDDWDEVDGTNAEGPEPEEPGSSASSPKGADVETILHDTTIQEPETSILEAQKAARKKKVKISKHGIQYPSLPAGVVKKLATTYARTSGNSKTKISKDTLNAIVQASDWFFEQVSGDLSAYAKHAGRKTIDESDVVTLMKRFVLFLFHDEEQPLMYIARQRQTNANATPFSLAQKYLPRELLQELRMVPPSKLKQGKQLDIVEEADEDE